jgi:hypothetical protein
MRDNSNRPHVSYGVPLSHARGSQCPESCDACAGLLNEEQLRAVESEEWQKERVRRTEIVQTLRAIIRPIESIATDIESGRLSMYVSECMLVLFQRLSIGKK